MCFSFNSCTKVWTTAEALIYESVPAIKHCMHFTFKKLVGNRKSCPAAAFVVQSFPLKLSVKKVWAYPCARCISYPKVFPSLISVHASMKAPENLGSLHLVDWPPMDNSKHQKNFISTLSFIEKERTYFWVFGRYGGQSAQKWATAN